MKTAEQILDLPNPIRQLIYDFCDLITIRDCLLTCRRHRWDLRPRLFAEHLLQVCLARGRYDLRPVGRIVRKLKRELHRPHGVPNSDRFKALRRYVRGRLTDQQVVWIVDRALQNDDPRRFVKFFVYDLRLDRFAALAPGLLLYWASMSWDRKTFLQAIDRRDFPNLNQIPADLQSALSDLMSQTYRELLDRFQYPTWITRSDDDLSQFHGVTHQLLKRLPERAVRDPDLVRDLIQFGIRFDLYSYVERVRIVDAADLRNVALFLSRDQTPVSVVIRHLIQGRGRYDTIAALLSVPEYVDELRGDMDECLYQCLVERDFSMYRQLTTLRAGTTPIDRDPIGGPLGRPLEDMARLVRAPEDIIQNLCCDNRIITSR